MYNYQVGDYVVARFVNKNSEDRNVYTFGAGTIKEIDGENYTIDFKEDTRVVLLENIVNKI